MSDEDMQLALHMSANSISVEDDPDSNETLNSPKPLRRARVLDLNERRKQFR